MSTKGTIAERLDVLAFWLEQRRDQFTDAVAIDLLDVIEEAKRSESRVAELEEALRAVNLEIDEVNGAAGACFFCDGRRLGGELGHEAHCIKAVTRAALGGKAGK